LWLDSGPAFLRRYCQEYWLIISSCDPFVSSGTSYLQSAIGLLSFATGSLIMIGLTELSRRRTHRLQEFERVVQGLDEMIVVVDRDYRYLIANPAFLKYREMQKEQVLGHRADEVLNPEVFRSTVKPKMDEAFQGKVVRYEMQYQYLSMGPRDLSVSYFPIQGRHGVDRIAAILRDVTEKKRAATALKESEDRYRDLVEHSEDLVCTHDLAGNLLSVNPAPALVLGYTTSELLKIPMADLVAPEFRDQFGAYLGRIKTTGSDRGMLCVMTRTGERRIWKYSNTLRTEGVAQPIVRGMAHDITECMRAEACLRRSEHRYRMLFEKTIAGVAIVRMDGYVLDCNDAWAHILGYDSAKRFEDMRPASSISIRMIAPHCWMNYTAPAHCKAGRCNFDAKTAPESGSSSIR
jgi:PAS domain S-box-containing protein